MEIRNDKILKFSGRSPNDIYDFDNIYSPDGIGIQLVNSNTQISFINTVPNISNSSRLNINFRNSNINFSNSIGILNLNNNILFTFNVSATQELHKKLKKQKLIIKKQEKRIQEQEELLKDRERRLKENEEKIEKLFQLLAMKQS